ncbi:MAG: putative terminase large subunit [Prokaryotic dsDNA virus sp.]|nr:MAG: putative terminase large subunit [Prokaryotic dsDNA virus sp.]
MVNVDPRLQGRDGFKNWLYLAWGALGLPEPTRIQYDIGDFLANGPRRCVIQAFRGVGKSYITSAYVVWRLLLDPSLNFLVISASKNRSDDFSTFSLRLIEEMGQLTAHLRPRENQRCSKVAFDVGPAPPAHAPSVTSKGVFSSITGARATEIICDDVASWANSQTQMMRDKLAAATAEYEAILKPGGRIIYLGTPQTEQDILKELPERGFKTRIWPAKVPTAKQKTNYGEMLAPSIQEMEEPSGTPTDPKRFDGDDLLERELSYGRTMFNLQFMLDQSLSDLDRYPLKINDLMVTDLDSDKCYEKYVWCNDPDKVINDLPCVGFNGDRYFRPMATDGDLVDYETKVLAVDPSGAGTDETAIAVTASYAGQAFVLECRGIKGGFGEPVLAEIAQIAKKHKVNLILVESNLGQGMFSSLLKPHLAKVYPCGIEDVRHHIQKEKRICDTIEPLAGSRRLLIDRSVIQRDYDSVQDLPADKARQYQLMYQFSRITRDRGALRHDDRLDALSMALGFHADAMARDRDREMHEIREDKHNKMLEAYMESGPSSVTIGAKPTSMTWLS